MSNNHLAGPKELSESLTSQSHTHHEMESDGSSIQEKKFILHRRFDRMARLVGDNVMEHLYSSHVMVIGLGGVGSWAAEALARSGVGAITVVDFDEICITNANRQIHALQGLVGQKKAKVMAERLSKINPQARIRGEVEFFSEKTASMLLELKPDYIVDAIDNLTAKCFLLNEANDRKIPIITSAGAAGRLDPSAIKIVDLGQTHTDPMAHQIRKILRSRYENFKAKDLFDIPCVFSTEIPTDPINLKYDK